ncbi:mechanosensitive ion channel [Carboxylicivirga sp. A043]|uniref:mechanosensitive ion channel family protein n=1 Tax=Carboxylicivirga litoralis TaxID=2816963 RepID=UPI0021CB6D8D|nr:mechanosensitive ion channel domain-containing protein [Carboxylicivirga sp. A043]MCU4157033.1 mechanosensitive ion channel [Carboxylicivirga sp. A043]
MINKLALILLFCSYIHLFNAQCQETTDSTAVKTIVDVIEIPARSAEAIKQLNQLQRNMLNSEHLKKIISNDTTTLNLIDSLTHHEKGVELIMFNKRHLVNKRSLWNQRLQQVESIKNDITEQLEDNEDLALKAQAIGNEWSNIALSIPSDEQDSIVSANIEQVIVKNDSLLKQLHQQRSVLLAIQNRNISKTVDITNILERIENKVNQERHNIFARSNISFAQIFNARQYASAITILKKNLSIELKLMGNYLKDKEGNAFLFIIILVFGMFIFRQAHKNIIRKGNLESDGFYMQQFKRILTAYLSTAFVLVIWFSALLFPNQPLLFKDAIRIIICIPLTILLYRLIDKKLFFSIVILFSLILVQSVINLFPPNHMAYRLYLLIAILLELFVMFKIKAFVKTIHFKSKVLSSALNKLMLLAVGLISLVILLGILGYFVLGELVVNLVLINAFSICLLYVSMLIVIGIIELVFNYEKTKRLKVIQHYGDSIKNRLIQFITIVTPLLVIYIILASINFDEPVVNAIINSITYQFKIGEMSFSIGRIITLIIILSLSVFVSNVIKVILEEDVFSHTKLSKGLPHTIALLAKYALITIGVSLAFSVAGFPMENFAVLIGAFGVGIGFGLQNIFNNLVSGLILLFERPIKIDDVIEVGELRGRVRSIGIRSSVVRTFDGAEVIVPNGQLISNEVINWTHSDQIRRYEVLVGVAYGSDVEQVKTILEEQIAKHDDILTVPEPSVLFINMGDSSLDFRMLYWISKVRNGLEIHSAITQQVYNALNEAGIEIPFPQRDVHIKSKD